MSVLVVICDAGRRPSAATPGGVRAQRRRGGVLGRTNLLVGGSFVRAVQIFGPQWTIRRCTQRSVRPDMPKLATTRAGDGHDRSILGRVPGQDGAPNPAVRADQTRLLNCLPRRSGERKTQSLQGTHEMSVSLPVTRSNLVDCYGCGVPVLVGRFVTRVPGEGIEGQQEDACDGFCCDRASDACRRA